MEMNMMLKLFSKSFKTVVIKTPQQATTNSLETKEKSTISQRNRSYKKEPYGNYRTIQSLKTQNSLDGLTVEWK